MVCDGAFLWCMLGVFELWLISCLGLGDSVLSVPCYVQGICCFYRVLGGTEMKFCVWR